MAFRTSVGAMVRRWWRMRYPAYLAGLLIGLAMIWPAYGSYQAPVQIWINPDEPDDFVTGYGSLSKQQTDVRFLIAVVGVWVSGAALISSVDGAARYLRGRRRQRGKIPAQPAETAETAETAPRQA